MNPPAPRPYASIGEHLDDELRWVTAVLERRHRMEWLLFEGHHELNLMCLSREDTLVHLRALDPAAAEPRRAAWDALSARVIEARRRADARAALDPGATPLLRLRQAFALDDDAYGVLLLALAPELSERARALMAMLMRDMTRQLPSVGLLMDLLAPDASARLSVQRALSPDATLLRLRLLHVSRASAAAASAWERDDEDLAPSISGVAVAGAVVRFITCAASQAPPRARQAWRRRVAHDPRLRPEPLEGLAELDEVFEGLAPWVERGAAAWGSPSRPWILLHGRDQHDCRAVALNLCALLQRSALLIDLRTLLPVDASEDTRELADHEREALMVASRDALMGGALLILDRAELLNAHPLLQRELTHLLTDWPDHVILIGETALSALVPESGEAYPVQVRLPDAAWRAILWEEALGPEASAALGRDALQRLARNYALSRDGIIKSTRAARAREAQRAAAAPSEAPPSLYESLLLAARAQLRHGLSAVADRVEHLYRWEDIVLSPDHLETLREMVLFVQNRHEVFDRWGFGRQMGYGRGSSALFSGPPGTGKTMAASVIAGELNMELFKVDLSRIVSKWVGETEKNLSRVFDEAQRAHGILLFDEADSLFSKRTEVKSSVDRYANLEVNYLLQRMEAYDGICILTTNFEAAIDDAFKRRIRFKVSFPFPDEVTRGALWQRLVCSSDAPIDEGIDFDGLGADYEIAGGSIRNAVLRAAFYAARDAASIQERHLRLAALRECRELGQLVRGKDT